MGLLVSHTDKGTAELSINSKFNVFWGQFFRYATHLGDGIFYAILIAFFLLVRYYYAILLFFTSILQTILAQGMKRFVFPDALRPSAYFENHPDISLQFAEGVKIHSAHSFPSGHTATAFALAIILSHILPKKSTVILFFVLALVAAFSRVYLMQHFFEDILAGAAIGIFSGATILLIMHKLAPDWSQKTTLQRGLLRS